MILSFGGAENIIYLWRLLFVPEHLENLFVKISCIDISVGLLKSTSY